MSWGQVRGHDAVVEQFRLALGRGRMASTFLFVGHEGIGKRTFALRLAQAMLCETRNEAALEPCQRCASCLQVAASSHPDVEVLARPADKAFIPLELLIGEKERRMREGLCYQLSLQPYSGRRKSAIIDDADYLNKEGANCLLTTLEEPPPKSVLILIGTSEQRQLPTIRSRCQTVRFRPLPTADLAALLVEQGVCTDPADADRVAALGQGSFTQAVRRADPRFHEFREQLLEQLAHGDFDLLPLAKSVSQFVDEAGKESAAKRARLKEVVALAQDFYRERLQTNADGDAEPAAVRVELCLETYGHIDANVGQANVIEWWLNQLAVL